MSSGKKIILCMTDVFSKYGELVTIPDKNCGLCLVFKMVV
jgi:hypothetical protein